MFEIVGRRHLGFFLFENFNGLKREEVQTVTV